VAEQARHRQPGWRINARPSPALAAASALIALKRAMWTSGTGMIGIAGILFSHFHVPLTVVGPLAGAPVACGASLHRDHNAAHNIVRLGQERE
jgi:hypothetical protein